MKRTSLPTTYRIALILIAVGGLVGLGVGYFHRNPEMQGPFKEVEIQKHKMRLSIQATGDVEALNRVDILPAVPGRVDRILVQEGRAVKENEIIAWMSSTNRAALLDLAHSKTDSESKEWEAMYEPTPVLAPVTGVITKKNVVPGQMVSASSVLFSMSDRLIVRAQVDETDIAKIYEGMGAEVTLDAYPTNVFQGSVHLIGHDSQLVNSVNVYLVEVWPKILPIFYVRE